MNDRRVADDDPDDLVEVDLLARRAGAALRTPPAGHELSAVVRSAGRIRAARQTVIGGLAGALIVAGGFTLADGSDTDAPPGATTPAAPEVGDGIATNDGSTSPAAPTTLSESGSASAPTTTSPDQALAQDALITVFDFTPKLEATLSSGILDLTSASLRDEVECEAHAAAFPDPERVIQTDRSFNDIAPGQQLHSNAVLLFADEEEATAFIEARRAATFGACQSAIYVRGFRELGGGSAVIEPTTSPLIDFGPADEGLVLSFDLRPELTGLTPDRWTDTYVRVGRGVSYLFSSGAASGVTDAMIQATVTRSAQRLAEVLARS